MRLATRTSVLVNATTTAAAAAAAAVAVQPCSATENDNAGADGNVETAAASEGAAAAPSAPEVRAASSDTALQGAPAAPFSGWSDGDRGVQEAFGLAAAEMPFGGVPADMRAMLLQLRADLDSRARPVSHM